VRWLTTLVAGLATLALLLPAAGLADHIVTAATVDALGDEDNDVLRGQVGNDRLTGGAGADVLIGGPGVNAYDAGPGADFVDARNGKRELMRCGKRPRSGARRPQRSPARLRARESPRMI
jgi:hypothetical protein